MVHHLYDTPTFKTRALRLVNNEGQVQHLLLLYKRLMQPYLLAITDDASHHFHPYNTPTFKTIALHLVSNKGRVKCLLLLHRRIIQRYLSLLGCNWQHILLLGPHLSMTSSHKMELQSNRNCSPLISRVQNINSSFM